MIFFHIRHGGEPQCRIHADIDRELCHVRGPARGELFTAPYRRLMESLKPAAVGVRKGLGWSLSGHFGAWQACFHAIWDVNATVLLREVRRCTPDGHGQHPVCGYPERYSAGQPICRRRRTRFRERDADGRPNQVAREDGTVDPVGGHYMVGAIHCVHGYRRQPCGLRSPGTRL